MSQFLPLENEETLYLLPPNLTIKYDKPKTVCKTQSDLKDYAELVVSL